MTNTRSIRRILIANRGEIARRIIRTCSRLGVETVAVFTTVDEHAPFVHEATHSEPLGSPDSYLSIEKILAAAARSGADAVHPGYGFLSENADFAEAVTRAGLIWIGPSSDAIRRLGSKTAAKELAAKANVPVSPTLLLSGEDAHVAARTIEEFGRSVQFPLILKAAAGGGGRGMRFIHQGSDTIAELESARREALKAFGSDEIFVEKCITPARHIEVQLAADSHGNAVALGSRDCSLQRNNQKIIEEAPAINLAPGVEQKLFDASVALAKASGYSNLGTVEFLYSSDGSFYFLEVNTRLQVEHPVTELTTGLDLVEIQLAIAQGRSLPDLGISSTPTPRGHAIEARWCAEEYTEQFTTSIGTVLEIVTPMTSIAGSTVRVDRGVEPCSKITPFYDSMIGKVIIHADDRASAISALTDTLSRSRMSGVRTNRALLLHLLDTQEFQAFTHSVQGTKALLPAGAVYRHHVQRAHAFAAAIRCCVARSSWVSNGPWITDSNSSALHYPWKTTTNGETLTSRTKRQGGGLLVEFTGEAAPPPLLITVLKGPSRDGSLTSSLLADATGLPILVSLYQDGADIWVHTPESSIVLREESIGDLASAREDATGSVIRSTIPGKVAAISVKEGDTVEHGAVLLVLDSMKMEHPIRAPKGGKVVSLPLPVGALVQAGSTLAVIE
jgi:acetyl/propionyl-CoA carboxylase alpha subunit